MKTMTARFLLPAPLYAVSAEWEYNGHDDSDWYRVFYNPNTRTLERHETHSTRYGCGRWESVTLEYAQKIGLPTYHNGMFTPECHKHGALVMVPIEDRWFVPPDKVTPDVWQAAESALADLIFRELLRQDIAKATAPTAGRVCKVIKGRKIKIGETVTVMRVGEPTKYAYSAPLTTNALCKVQTHDGLSTQVWTNVLNLEVIDPCYSKHSELRKQAAEYATRRDFYSFFRTSRVSMV